jgi:hypothetical protein
MKIVQFPIRRRKNYEFTSRFEQNMENISLSLNPYHRFLCMVCGDTVGIVRYDSISERPFKTELRHLILSILQQTAVKISTILK